MAARVKSQADSAGDGADPSIPSAFRNDLTLGATEAIMWIACRRRFSHETIREHLERRDRNLRRRTGSEENPRLQVSPALSNRVDKANLQLFRLIIAGVPAIGTLDDEGDPKHDKRVAVPVEFLKDGAFIDLLSGHLWTDPLLENMRFTSGLTYRDVCIDRDAFFKALAAAEPASTRRRGARPKYDWAAFRAEVARRDDLPTKQAHLERAMTDWCVATWGEDSCPGESTIRAQVSRYYLRGDNEGQ